MDGYDSLNCDLRARRSRSAPCQLSITVLWWFLFVAVSTWILQRTKIGNWIFAVGGNAASARAVGVPVTQGQDRPVHDGRRSCAGSPACTTCTGSTRLQAGNGVGNEFLYIIAAVVGGTLLTGGYGNAIGVAIGAFIFGMTSLCIVYAGWDPNWFKAFLGVMLLLAVLVNLYVKKLSTTRKGGLAMTDTICKNMPIQTLHKGEPLVEMIDVGKTYGAIRALKGINLHGPRRGGHVRARRQRRRQVDLDQDHLRAAPAQRGNPEGRWQGGPLLLPARVARPRHRDRLPGPRRREPDGGVAQLLPRLGDDLAASSRWPE